MRQNRTVSAPASITDGCLPAYLCTFAHVEDTFAVRMQSCATKTFTCYIPQMGVLAGLLGRSVCHMARLGILSSWE